MDFLHRPAAPEFEEMQFPDLADFHPDFNNVAPDVVYADMSDALPSIAPTAHQRSGLDLPAIMDAPGMATTAVPVTFAPPPPASTAAPPPPPPPPPPVSVAPPPPMQPQQRAAPAPQKVRVLLNHPHASLVYLLHV